MLPSRSMVDSVVEASRLCPTLQIDGDTSNTYTSPFQNAIANRYSSSTDSTSPESSFNTQYITSQPLEHNTPRMYESILNSQHNSPIHTFESPKSNFNNSFIDSTTFDRNTTGYKTYFDNTKSFDTTFTVSESHNYEQGFITDTSPHARQLRAIVGRKILDCFPSESGSDAKSDLDANIPHHIPQKTKMQYQLFPSKGKNNELFSSTINDTCTLSSRSSNSSSFLPQTADRIQYDRWSPISNINQNLTLTSLNTSFYTEENLYQATNNNTMLSPNYFNRINDLSPSMVPFPAFKPPFNPTLGTTASSRKDEIGPSQVCMFCRKNGETPSVFMNHTVKEKIGNRYIVTCPILRALVCGTCGASGDNAHTISYCPVLRMGNNGKPLQSTTVTLKNTRIKSNGRKRY